MTLWKQTHIHESIVHDPVHACCPANIIRCPYVVKKLAFIVIGAGLLAAGAAAFVGSHHESKRKPIESLYRYQVPTEPTSLTEDLAMAYANKALLQDGLSTNLWHAAHDRRTDNWGSAAGLFAVRNKNNSNHVCIVFSCAKAPAPRFVSVYLLGKVVMCTSSVPD